MRREQSLFDVVDIEQRVEPYDWAFARDEAARIDAHWAAQCRRKPKLYDGRVLLAHRIERVGDRLRGACFETGFKSFLAWRDFGFPGAPIANCFAMAALITSDGAFMLGEMSAGTANEGRLYFPAGTPEPADVDANGNVDLEGSVLRELEEETGLTRDDIVVETGWTIVIDGPRVGCMKTLRSRETAAALEARVRAFNEGQADPELVRIVPVRRSADLDAKRMPEFMCRYLRHMLESR